MSGIGHLAAGFALKPSARQVPLWVLLAAGETNDILYFAFTAVGIESQAPITIDFAHGVTYLSTASNPWSHGLFMSVIWSLLAVGIAFVLTRDRRASGIIGLAVLSHWLLDFLMHSNLPLFFEGSPLLGLGLENSGPGLIFMTALDLLLLGAGLYIYLRDRKQAPSTPTLERFLS